MNIEYCDTQFCCTFGCFSGIKQSNIEKGPDRKCSKMSNAKETKEKREDFIDDVVSLREFDMISLECR